MGCDTCKQKNSKNLGEGETINLLPSEIIKGDFSISGILIKFIAFVVILIAIPPIILILAVQLFLQFFFPKSLIKLTKKLNSVVSNIFTKYSSFIVNRKIKKREKQFQNNTKYEVENYVNETGQEFEFEVYENNEKEK